MEQFFQDLAALKDQGWRLMTMKQGKDMIINAWGECPIRAVANYRKVRTTFPFYDVGREIGFYKFQTIALMDAADGVGRNDIRQRLLDTLGLTDALNLKESERK